jgi:hypothetical protein
MPIFTLIARSRCISSPCKFKICISDMWSWDHIHSGHVPWTLPGHLQYFHWFSDAFPINIQLSWHSLVYFEFLTYERYHMLIAQPLRPITNHITVCFTFIPSFLPLAYHITGDWGIFAYITWPLIYYCDALLKRWLLHSSHDIPIHFAIFIIWFRIFSPFYIYLTLPYPHKKNRREIRSPHRLGLLQHHCDCVSTVTASYTSCCGF